MSSFLLILIEILGIKLRHNTTIKRIGSHADPKLHAQYADDIWAAIKYDLESLYEILLSFSKFSEFSGLNVNMEKTKFLKVGPVQYTPDFYQHMGN